MKNRTRVKAVREWWRRDREQRRELADAFALSFVTTTAARHGTDEQLDDCYAVWHNEYRGPWDCSRCGVEQRGVIPERHVYLCESCGGYPSPAPGDLTQQEGTRE